MKKLIKKPITKRIRFIILFSILILILILLVSLIIWETDINPTQKSLKSNLTLEIGKCTGPGPDVQKFISSDWKNNSISIKTVLSPNCAKSKIVGDYEIRNEDLILFYKDEHRLFESGETACICPTEVKFIINDIEKKDYKIILQYDSSL